jgi:V8-like Glu-specific endopeptidase
VTIDWQNVEQYDGTLGVTNDFVNSHETPVGNLQWNNNLSSGNVSGRRWCSGTLITNNLFLTAGHCLDPHPNDGRGWDWPLNNQGNVVSAQNGALMMHVNFNYQLDASGSLQAVQKFAVTSLREYRVNGLDMAILQLAGNPGITFGVAEISSRTPIDNELLSIIQFPGGIPKVIHTGFYDGIGPSGYMRYVDLDTAGGSSGAGILDAVGRLVGVHVRGGCSRTGGANKGVPLGQIRPHSQIIQQIIVNADKRTQVHYWPMLNGIRMGGINIDAPVDDNWKFKGAGDVDSNGTDDVIWQHINGQVHYWPMVNGVRVGGINIHTPVDANWELKGVGDVDGNGTDDVIWQHINGQVHYWSMVTGVKIGGINIHTPVDASWGLKGVGDVDGDGTDDLIWQHINGQVHYWSMVNGVRVGGINIHTSIDTSWKLKGASDLDGDGIDDIIWNRNVD